jgi:methionyl-tRNA synthetase
MGDYADQQARWERIDLTPGTPLSKPAPLFTRLDPELAENGPEWARVEKD